MCVCVFLRQLTRKMAQMPLLFQYVSDIGDNLSVESGVDHIVSPPRWEVGVC